MDPNRLLKTLIAGTFLLAAAACDQRPSAEKVGRDIDRALQKVEPTVERAAKAVSEKTAVAAEKIDDVTLSARVKTALIAEPGVRARDVNVDSKDGVVALHGQAASAEAKALAAKIAGAVQGVKSVDNRLVVAGS